jgi:Domain of unknown function (4846)
MHLLKYNHFCMPKHLPWAGLAICLLPFPELMATGNLPPNPYPSIEAIPLPAGFKRIPATKNSFAGYLRKIPLKKNRMVHLYNGRRKSNQTAQFAVLDVPLVPNDLQQCADAIMRLRAEYLRSIGQPICFYDNLNRSYCWTSYQRQGWQGYLSAVFGMCGTISLSRMLVHKDWQQLQVGDVVIQPGSPGHAMLVVDMAVNAGTRQCIFMLAQSYMPAQDIHIVLNPRSGWLSPWYGIPITDTLLTPEWTFRGKCLMGWP